METQQLAPMAETQPVQPPTGYLTLKQAWWLIVVLFLWQIPLAIPYGIINYTADNYDVNLHGLLETLLYILAFGLTIRTGFRKRGNSTIAVAPLTGWAFPVIALGTLALGILIEPLTSVLPVPNWMNDILKKAFTKDAIWSAVIFAPVLEEILLRGIILDGLLKRYSPTKAIVWSAVIFSVMHMNPAQAVGAFLLGLPLGWLYYRTRSLWPCIFLHFVNNTIGSLALFFEDNLDMSANYTRAWVGSDHLYIALLLGCVAIVGSSYVVLNRMLPAPISVTTTE